MLHVPNFTFSTAAMHSISRLAISMKRSVSTLRFETRQKQENTLPITENIRPELSLTK